MWFRWMILAFLLNGLCTFGLRILAVMGLAGQYTSSYLVFWYLAGAVFIAALFLLKSQKPVLKEVLVGSALGFCSVCGQTSMGLALSRGLPGHVVFPVALAGGLFIVVAAAVFLFKERLGKAGVLGIALGILSIALLSLE